MKQDDEIQLDFLQKDEKPAEPETIEEKKEKWRKTLARYVDENGKISFDLYVETYGRSDLALSSSHYKNLLRLLAAIYDCIDTEQLIEWSRQYNSRLI